MLPLVTKTVTKSSVYYLQCRNISKDYRCKLLVLGGGTGGCAVAAKFSKILKQGEIIILDPADDHYYQPMFTLVGAGIKNIHECVRPMSYVLPSKCTWVKDKALEIVPSENHVRLAESAKIHYEYLVVSTGITLDLDKVAGLKEALKDPNSGVSTIYSPKYASKTFKDLQEFSGGNLVFTFPNTPVKCAGAPQKICYLADSYLRQYDLREKAEIHYCTALPVLFSCKHYADPLWEIMKKKDINVHLRTSLSCIDIERKRAVFSLLDEPDKKFGVDYSLLHVAPPLVSSKVLLDSPDVTDAAGFLEVNKETLKHVKYENIFGLGDCTNLPTSKTAAATAAQSKVLYENLLSVMNGKKMTEKYNGYTSCPLVTSYNSVMLAEFDYNMKPLETFPFDQRVERKSMFYMKKIFMPFLYWNLMMKGLWDGPAWIRSMFNFRKN